MKTINCGKSTRVQILLNEPLNKQLSLAAKKYGVTKSAIIRVALEREFTLERKLEREIRLHE
jgi:hypothetical protein